MVEDRLQSVKEQWSVLYEITKLKHGIRQIPIQRAIELKDDLEWCIARSPRSG